MEPPNWLVPAAVLVAAIITAFVTWRTFKQKEALELNDKRSKIYKTVKSCVDQVTINSQRFNELENDFLEAKHQAYFLFGDDVNNYLETLRKDILIVRDIDKQVASLQKQNKPITDLAKLGAKRDEAMTRIQKFYEVGQQKFASRPRS
jgi:hypothetical protein